MPFCFFVAIRPGFRVGCKKHTHIIKYKNGCRVRERAGESLSTTYLLEEAGGEPLKFSQTAPLGVPRFDILDNNFPPASASSLDP